MEELETVKECCQHEDCVYRMKLESYMPFCGYILLNGMSRNCKISECDKYKKGRIARKHIDGRYEFKPGTEDGDNTTF